MSQSMGTIPSLHTQIRFKHKSDLGESFEAVSRDEEKDLRCNVDSRAHEFENASISSFPQLRM
jgi:hypothetical protein